MAAFKDIDPAAFVALRAAEKITLIDVRTDAEVARGIISGAIHIPLQTLPGRIGELDPSAAIVVYCQSGMRSAQACGFLAMRGYGDVANLQGGLIAWARAGFQLDPPG